MKSINIKDIKEITLLSKEEADRVDKEILVVNDNWWLRSIGTFGCVYAIDYTGCNDSIFHPSSCSVYVRPALRINNLQSYNLEKNEEVECLGKTWIAIGVNDLILMKDTLFPHRFDNENGNFEKSEIKQVINDWLLGRLKEQKSEHNDIVDALQYIVREPSTIQADLKKFTQPLNKEELEQNVQKAFIEPFVEEMKKVEPLRNDRFRDFKKSNDCNDFYISIDAKDVKTITMTYEKHNKTISIYVDDYCVKSVVNKIDEQECLAFYKDLIEWRNYWKQN